MNTIKLNTIMLNVRALNLVGKPASKREGGSDVPSGDIPEGYAEFITAEGLVFSAVDGDFYVKL